MTVTRIIAIGIAWCSLLVPAVSVAETGMCLVVCTGDGTEKPGNIKRIDIVDNTVTATSDNVGYGLWPRFSPDGNSFAYVTGTTVKVCGLDGTVKSQFTVGAADGNITYTANGIWQASGGTIRRYDLNGNQTWSKSFNPLKLSTTYVSQNEERAAGVENYSGNWRVIIYNLADGTSKPLIDEQGCSGCPSPDGSLVTQNVGQTPSWDYSNCHVVMRIRNASGSINKTLWCKDITGLPDDVKGYGWNRQCWSGNSNDWIVLPVGKSDGSSVCRGPVLNCSPWIYNISTNQALRLADRTSDFWMPTDYFSGTVHDPAKPSLELSTLSLDFSADVGGAAPAPKTVEATTASGTLEGVSTSGAPAWLTVALSVTSGPDITITNTANLAGLTAGEYNATVNVATTNAGEKSYTVRLVVKTAPVFTSIAVAPPMAVAAPGGTAVFSATALDQYGTALASQPTFTWAVGGGGTFTGGTFTAGPAVGGPFTVTASSGGKQGNAQVLVASTPDVHVKVNCGSNTYDVAGWERDDGYVSGGMDYTWPNPDAVSTAGVTNAAPADVYKSVRHTAHTYSFPEIKNGVYIVRLHLVDAFGGRSMSYALEGKTVLSGLDILTEAGGAYQALVKDLPVCVVDGNGLEIGCTFDLDDVFEAGLEIIGFVFQPPAIRILSPNGGETFKQGDTLRVRWESANPSASFVLQLSFDGGLGWTDLTGQSGVSGGEFEWRIPGGIVQADGDTVSTKSGNCLIKMYNYASVGEQDVSDAEFGIESANYVSLGNRAAGGPGFVLATSPGGALRLDIAARRRYSVSLIAANGARILSQSGVGPAAHTFRDVSLPAGIYVVDLMLDEAKVRRRVMVMR